MFSLDRLAGSASRSSCTTASHAPTKTVFILNTNMSPEAFAAQMRYLSEKGYSTVGIDDALKELSSPQQLGQVHSDLLGSIIGISGRKIIWFSLSYFFQEQGRGHTVIAWSKD